MPKTTFIDGNPALGVTGTQINAALLTALNSPKVSSQAIDAHFDFGWEDARAYGDGSMSAATLNTALAAIGATNKKLLIRGGSWDLGAATVTVPSNVTLAIETDSVVDNGVLAIGNFCSPGVRKVFDSGLSVQFGSGAVDVAYLEWFGKAGVSSAVDTAAFQACVDALNAGGGGSIRLLPGETLINASIKLYSGIKIEGPAFDYNALEADTPFGSTIRVPNADLAGMAGTPILDVSDTIQVGIKRIKFVAGTNTDPTLNTVSAIWNVDGVPNTATGRVTFMTVEDCHFLRFGGPIIKLVGYGANYIMRNRGNNLNSHFIWQLGGADSWFEKNETGAHQTGGEGDIGSGIRIEGGGYNTIINNVCENLYAGIDICGNASARNRIIGNRCEKNSGAGIYIRATGGGSAPRGNVVTGNYCYNNKRGLILANAAFENVVVGNSFEQNEAVGTGWGADNLGVQETGILITGLSTYNIVSENSIYTCSVYGVQFEESSHNKLSGNIIREVEEQGVIVQNSSSDNQIVANKIGSVGQKTDNTYDAILVSALCSRNLISSNQVRHGGGAAQSRYAIRINTANCEDNIVGVNDTINGGKTGDFSDAGTRTTRQYVSGGQHYFGQNVNAVSAIFGGTDYTEVDTAGMLRTFTVAMPYQITERNAAAVTSGMGLGARDFRGAASSATNKNRTGARISAIADADWDTDNANYAPTRVRIGVQDASASDTLAANGIEIDKDGNVYILGAKSLSIGGLQSLGPRITGFVAMAGTAVKDGSGINADTIQAIDADIRSLAKYVKALGDALATHGPIGA